MLFVLTSLSALASVSEDVAHGWYLWETGRSDEAHALAAELAAAHPDAIPVLELYAAMQVDAERGASVEAELLERFSQDPSDVTARVGLAYAVTYRHARPGPWCDEVNDLVVSVVEGEPHAWATLAEREAEIRCRGASDHADAELIRLARDPESPAWADGVLARADAGYLRAADASAVEQLWAVAPERLDRAAGLWAESTSGPGRKVARRATKKALAFAADSAEAPRVWAALQAYRDLGWEKEAAGAEARLRRSDPEAKLDLDRDRHTITDPPLYAEIDACFEQPTESDIRACSAEIEDPGPGAVGAHLHYRRFLAHRAFGEPQVALDEAIAAVSADPELRSYSRLVVIASLEVPTLTDAQGAAVAEAVDALLAEDPTIERGGSTMARRWARDLLLAARVERRVGNDSRAADLFLRGFALDPSASRRLELGRSLADAGQQPSAVLHLGRGLVEAMDEPELIRDARKRLDKLAKAWGRRDANQVLQEVIGAPGPRSPLMGEVLEGGWDWPEGDPSAWVVVLWGELFQEPGEKRFAELRAAASLAASDEDVGAIALDVGLRKANFPEGIELPHASAGPLLVQSLQIVALPTMLVLDGDKRLRAVISPFGNDDDADVELLDAVDAVRGQP